VCGPAPLCRTSALVCQWERAGLPVGARWSASGSAQATKVTVDGPAPQGHAGGVGA
jgi:hypothetical protein